MGLLVYDFWYLSPNLRRRVSVAGILPTDVLPVPTWSTAATSCSSEWNVWKLSRTDHSGKPRPPGHPVPTIGITVVELEYSQSVTQYFFGPTVWDISTCQGMDSIVTITSPIYNNFNRPTVLIMYTLYSNLLYWRITVFQYIQCLFRTVRGEGNTKSLT